MNRKKATSSEGELTASQYDAIRLLVSGCTAKYTAMVLKLNYSDIRRWMKQDGRFQNEMTAQAEKQRTQSPQLQAQSQEKKPQKETARGEGPPRRL